MLSLLLWRDCVDRGSFICDLCMCGCDLQCVQTLQHRGQQTSADGLQYKGSVHKSLTFLCRLVALV
jgi:hypothetical protein